MCLVRRISLKIALRFQNGLLAQNGVIFEKITLQKVIS